MSSSPHLPRRSSNQMSVQSDISCDETTSATDATSSGTGSTGFYASPARGTSCYVLQQGMWNTDIHETRAQLIEGSQAFSNGINVRVKETRKDACKIVLRDDNKRTFAVCFKRITSGTTTYRIFRPTPVTIGQVPINKNSSSQRALYSWATVVDDSPVGTVEYTMSVWDGAEFVPTYKCSRKRALTLYHFVKFGAPSGLLERVSLKAREGSLKEELNAWKVTIHPLQGDPCLLLVFACIMDDLFEQARAAEQKRLREMAESLSSMLSGPQKSPDRGNGAGREMLG